MDSQISFDFDFISNLLDKKEPEHKYVNEAINFLEDTLPNYINSETTELYISFNGGKDATVILFLTYIALKRLQQRNPEKYNNNKNHLNTVYFEEPNSFEEVDIFIDSCQKLMNFTQIKLERNFKQSLETMVNNHNMKAVIMGNRRDDPYCENLEKISPSDVHKGYIPFLRINPIIDWKYDQVWKFLLDFKIPYCSLYNHGYTYLGNKDNTQQNQHLLVHENGQQVYLPAYKLTQHQYEQASRSQIQNNKQENNNSIGYLVIGSSEYYLKQTQKLMQEGKHIQHIFYINSESFEQSSSGEDNNNNKKPLKLPKIQYQTLQQQYQLEIVSDFEVKLQ